MRIYPLIILMAYFFSACKKSNTSEPLHARFDPSSLEYVQLQPSKYFIYKDSVTSQIDSVIVTTTNFSTVFVPESNPTGLITVPAYNQERFHLVLTKFSGLVSEEWLNASAYAIIPTNIPFQSTDSSLLKLTEQDNTTVFYNINPSETMVIEGITYNNVIRTFSTFGGDITNTYFKDATYFWAKGVGIIKREIKTFGGAVKTQTLLRHN